MLLQLLHIHTMIAVTLFPNGINPFTISSEYSPEATSARTPIKAKNFTIFSPFRCVRVCMCLCAPSTVCSLHSSWKKKTRNYPDRIRNEKKNLNTTRKIHETTFSSIFPAARSRFCNEIFRILRSRSPNTWTTHSPKRGLGTVRTHHTVSVHTLGCWSPLLAGKISFSVSY